LSAPGAFDDQLSRCRYFLAEGTSEVRSLFDDSDLIATSVMRMPRRVQPSLDELAARRCAFHPSTRG
jgi:hypothetical protein